MERSGSRWERSVGLRATVAVVVVVTRGSSWLVEVVCLQDAEHDVVGGHAVDPVGLGVVFSEKFLHKFCFLTEGADRKRPNFLVEEGAVSCALLDLDFL